ncbi:MAG: sigma 54-interacting transcriptional regulator [Deltaproteobacteria bacterium]|nr:sigma 54-interacting transcriptional regulator [Deltaproteobacteria bacterium]MBW2067264.1 sigma 54-interacting transcriptional regulator [Deltaproteobacteria bacterium]
MSIPNWFRSLMESLPDPVVYYDSACHIVGSNEKGKKEILKTYNDLSYLRACELFSSLVAKPGKCEDCIFYRVRSENKPLHVSGEIVLPDGHKSYFERHVSIFNDTSGPILLELWKDLSQERGLTIENRTKDLFLKGLFNLFDIPMFTTDEHLRITGMNRPFEQLVRLPFSHLLGRSLDDIISIHSQPGNINENNVTVFIRSSVKRHPEVECDIKMLPITLNGRRIGMVGFAFRRATSGFSKSFPHYEMEYLFEISREASHKENLAEFLEYLDTLLVKHFSEDTDPLLVLFDEESRSFVWIPEQDEKWPLQLDFRKSMRPDTFALFHATLSGIPATDSIATPNNPTHLPKPLVPFAANYPKWFGFPIATHKRILGYFFLGISDGLPQYRESMYMLHAFMTQVAGHVRQLVLRELESRSVSWDFGVVARFGRLIGRSEKMREVYELIELVAASEATVLITGENGTGKELVALEIHQRSPRSRGPFVVAHCSAYSPTLLESELFGHERGAFTGAIKQKKGRIERAQGGTLFLDEIGDIAPATQVLLLRFLQDRKFERVGGEKTLEADVRILAATNKNLEEEVRTGRFREDLFYRLNVIRIHLPPLRERKEDIPLLCNHFIKKYNIRENKKVKSISQNALSILMEYDWPGNVRQLENTLSHAVILCPDDEITPEHLPRFLKESVGENGQPTTLEEHERRLIEKVLKDCNWNKHEAARRLNISRSTLYSKIKRYNLRKNEKPRELYRAVR